MCLSGEQAGTKRRPGKRITSPEKWEINQLIKAGVLDVTEYPTFDAEDGHGILNFDDDNEEEFEIDINDVSTRSLRELLHHSSFFQSTGAQKMAPATGAFGPG